MPSIHSQNHVADASEQLRKIMAVCQASDTVFSDADFPPTTQSLDGRKGAAIGGAVTCVCGIGTIIRQVGASVGLACSLPTIHKLLSLSRLTSCLALQKLLEISVRVHEYCCRI